MAWCHYLRKYLDNCKHGNPNICQNYTIFRFVAPNMFHNISSVSQQDLDLTNREVKFGLLLTLRCPLPGKFIPPQSSWRGIVFLKMRKDSRLVNQGAHAGADQPASPWVIAPSHCPQIPAATPTPPHSLLIYNSRNVLLILSATAQHRFPE